MQGKRDSRWMWAWVLSLGLLPLLGCPGGGNSDGGNNTDSGIEVDAGNDEDAGCRQLQDICTAEFTCCANKGLSCEGSLCCLSLTQTCAHDGECCSKSCVDNKCAVRTNCADAGSFCSISSQCCTGLSCYASECSACAGFAEPCGNGITCCGGLGCQQDGTCG